MGALVFLGMGALVFLRMGALVFLGMGALVFLRMGALVRNKMRIAPPHTHFPILLHTPLCCYAIQQHCGLLQ